MCGGKLTSSCCSGDLGQKELLHFNTGGTTGKKIIWILDLFTNEAWAKVNEDDLLTCSINPSMVNFTFLFFC